MEKSRLSPELQSIVDRFIEFRAEYSAVKTHAAAQEELIKLQKMELEKMSLRVEQLASALVDYQRRFNTTINRLEFENKGLQKVIENMKREYDKSREIDNNFVSEIQRHDDDYVRSLEDDLEELRAEKASEDEKHREQVRSIKARHNSEILIYEEKFKRVNSLEKRHRDEVDALKKKLEQFDSMERRCSVRKQEKDRASNTLPESIANNKNSEYTHPALSNVTEKTGVKRKKSAPALYKWPQLDISVKTENETAQKSSQRKKKKLYLADNETVIDLTH